MTKVNSTKKALLASFVALILCFSMLIGTTFAWFTDSVTSGTNRIIAGNLDVELWHQNSKTNGIQEITDNSENVLFNDIALWEPGVVGYETFTVKNVGTLALNYQMTFNIADQTVVNGHGLSEALSVGTTTENISGLSRAEVIATITNWAPLKDFSLSGELSAKTNATPVTVVIYWQPSANDNYFNMNNENQGKVMSINIGVTLVAGQKMEEKDSFDETYDYSAFIVVTPDTFEQTLANLKDGDQLYLQAGTYTVSANEKLKIVNNNVTIIGAGVDSTIIDAEDKTCSGQAALLIDGDNVTLKNFTVKSSSTSGNVAAIKVTNLREPGRIIDGASIENVAVEGKAGHGINLHGVENVVISGADVRSYGKCAIACAMATNVTVTGTKTTAGGWGADIGAMYGSGDAYATPSTITVKKDNSFGNGMVYTERPATAEGGADTLTFEAPNAWIKAVNGDQTTYTAAAASVGGVGYATLQYAIDNAAEGATVLVYDGTYTDLTVAKSDITVKGSKNVTFTGIITVAEGAGNVVLDNINLNYQGENLSNPAYGNVEIWGNNCTLKNCDLVAKYNPNDSQAIGSNFGMVRFNYGLNGTVENCTFKTNTMGMFPAMKTGSIKGCTFEPIDERRPLAINCTDMWGVEISNNTFYGLRILTNGNQETFSKNKFLNYTGTIFVNSFIGYNVATTIDLSDNYFGENPNFDQLLGTDGKVVVNTYYTDEAMTNKVNK